MTGSQLKQAREQLGLTQKQLALALGKHATTIARWEMPGGQPYPVPRTISLIVRMWLAKQAEKAP
jgi:transcriptional regulator with XRE-family HTH domain